MAMETKWSRLEDRKDFLDDALSFLEQTKALDLEYGRQEQVRSEKFTRLENALKSREIKIVVTGEFSRGKSMLLNALMGIELLPTALNQTTAVNAFVQKVTDDESPYVNIIFQDETREPETLTFEKHVIERWGTELDRENLDARQEVERIDIYTDHPIFQNDVILIDTPGFKGLIPRHEDIATQAINESHVAIWVQAADQLGGNFEEWEFLKKRIANNFNKFITVVNKWDLTHQEAQRLGVPVEKHSISQLHEIKENFFKSCQGLLTSDQIDLLTSEQNLMGISALWGLSDDPEKQEQSNIQRLADRIQEMCTTGEAQEEILLKPLSTMINIQNSLKADIKTEYSDLAGSPDLQSLKDEEEKIIFEKKQLEFDRSKAEEESRREHRVIAEQYAKEIQKELVEPLRELKAELEHYVTEDYVQYQIEHGVKRIELPTDIKSDYENVTQEMYDRWTAKKGELLKALEDLRADFKQAMSHISDRLNITFGELNFSLPQLNVNIDIDLNRLEAYQSRLVQINVEIEELEQEIEGMEEEKQKKDLSLEMEERKRKETEQRLRRLQMQRDGLGARPLPKKYTEERLEKGTWKDTPYTEEVIDDSNVKEWQRRKEELENMEENSEKELERIHAEWERKKGERISTEFAKKKLGKEMNKKRREIEKLQEKFQHESETKVSDIYNRMKKQTIYHVEKMIRIMEKQAASGVEKLFEDQLTDLVKCVQEQYADRIATRLKQLESVQQKMKEGEEALARRKEELKDMLARLDELMSNTADLRSRI